MQLKDENKISCDLLVISGGRAGLRAPVVARATHARVLMVSKFRIGQLTNTYVSKGVIVASGLGTAEDNVDVHAKDMIQSGRYLNDPSTVAEMPGGRDWRLPFCGHAAPQ
jgi:succinate dehydrogenase/fumarate reductase flavoprotein subunit